MKNMHSIEIVVPKPTKEKMNELKDKFTSDFAPQPKEDQGRDQSVVRNKLHEEIEDIKANRELRDKYLFKAFKVVKKSLWGWAILLFVYGVVKFLTRHENGGFEIFSDQVLIATTSATTLNIFAAFLSLIRGLFPSIKIKKEKKK
ncbi:hypothetical protein [Gilliamella bombi]|uniref:hypothetical protein n=1 Tax=Gilliamella bombi TaxID=1908521 RepID=UPI000A159D80|nr:hypothetical protein [Gilliamella bombi]